MKKQVFAILGFILLLQTVAYPQNNGNEIKNTISKLKTFLTDHITEKAYLQFDKPCYAAGDTVYFKAYVTMGERHELSIISNVLHVDLINTNNKVDQSIKLQLDSGLAWGDFALPDSLPKGNYRVRAYTQWMKNEGETAFFYKTIEVGSIANLKIPESMVRKSSPTLSGKADAQFFPEGGSLVAGIRSKVAFKAIGTNGSAINVKGVVVDNAEKEVTSFASVHLGMGYFYLNPEEGKTYKAKLSYADGTQTVIDLPAPDAKGLVLRVNNDSIPKASVRIMANNAYYLENKGKAYTVVIYSGGTATTVTCKLDSPMITMDILKRRLHTGIATVTLFSPDAQPLCERLLFVQNYDKVSLGINSDKITYARREKVNIKLNALNRAGNAAAGHFSMSVTDESKVPEDEWNENTIISNLLLTSDLKGYVEQPNYYFADTSAAARKNLDVLMLTQGYRRFEWKKVLDSTYPPIAYQAEKGLEISGMVKNLSDKTIAGSAITLLPVKGGPMLSSVTDAKGIFHFTNLAFMDTTHFALSAVNAKGKNSTKITYFNDKPEPVVAGSQLQVTSMVSDTTMAAYLENSKMERDEFAKYGDIKGKMLKEVKIKAPKEPAQRSQSYIAEFAADQVIHGKDILYGGPLSVRLTGLVHHVHFVPSGGNSLIPINNITMLPMEILIDGEPGKIDDVSTDAVETVEVLQPPNSYVYGQDGLNGVLVITTKPRTLASQDIPSIGVLPIAPMGFYRAREFYSPKYDNTSWTIKRQDLRSTIFWKPEIKTDKDGNASFEYFNADGTGTYKIIIEGIDDKGNLGRQVYRYKVE